TVGVAVVLTFFGLVYWLIPHLSGRVLTKKIHNLGIWQTMIWTVGMLFMSLSMSYAGLIGSPRRTEYTTYGGHPTALEWDPYLIFLGAGGRRVLAGGARIVDSVLHRMLQTP